MKRLVAASAALALAGCASFSDDGGFDTVEKAVRERAGAQARWIRSEDDASSMRARVTELLARPLTAEDAAQVALLNNPGLQATYAELGISEADLVQAGRMTNPHFAFLRVGQGEQRTLEWALTFPIIDLLTIPLRSRIEGQRFEQTKLSVAGRAVGTALAARSAWIRTVAAEQTVRYMEQVRESAEASAELARRMARIGNATKLTYMREQVFYAEVLAQLAQARQNAIAEREALTRLMGLFGDDLAFKLPGRLPDLPASMPELQEAEATAIAQRYDVQAARRDTEALAGALGLSKVTRFVSALEFGPAAEREGADAWKRGFELSLQVPLFDWGGARVAKAEATYLQAVNRLAETAIEARSEAREAYSAYRSAYETARHYRDEIVPLRKKIADENLLRYNGMLISVFELLADVREQVASINAAIAAQRDFWLAENEMQGALNGAPFHRGQRTAGGERRLPRDPVLAGH
jgi:outer membrane protein TolC